MRRPRPACGRVLAVIGVGAAGCLADPRVAVDRPADWPSRGPAAGGPVAAAGPVAHTALVDQPAPDGYLTRDLWDDPAVTNPLSAEATALLAANGLRVRRAGGLPPARLHDLLSSDAAAVAPTARTLRPGVPKVVPVRGPVDRVQFAVRRHLAADPDPVDLTDAECGLAVTARPAAGGRLTLACEPRAQHGGRRRFLRPADDASGFTADDRKPLAAFPELGFEATVGPADYLVVGPTADPAGTLGGAFFYHPDGGRLRQRVLVVRGYLTEFKVRN